MSAEKKIETKTNSCQNHIHTYTAIQIHFLSRLAILLEFYGQTKLEWLDLDKTSMADQIVHNDFSSKELHSMKTLYTNSHKHVCEQLELASNNQRQQQQILHPHVEYRYKFRFPIPVHAAATSRCPLGECEYGLRLIVQHPRKVNKEFHQRIVIKNKLDLSENIELREVSSIVWLKIYIFYCYCSRVKK